MADKYWVGGTGTWNTTLTTNWRTTSGGTTVAAVPTAADNVIFDANSGGTFTVTMTGALACLSITVATGVAATFATGTTPTLTVAGSMSLGSSTVWSTTGTTTFTATTSQTINTNGVTINSPFTFNGTGGTWTLQNNLTLGSTLTTTLTAGTLALSTFTLSTGLFSSASAVARTISFGTGKIVTTSATTSTVWNTSTITNLTISGTPLVECQGGGAAVTKTISPGALTETNSISFSLLETTGTVTYTITSGTSNVKNLIVNGSQTLTNSNIGIWGSFTHTTTNGTTTFTAGANAWIFAATSGSYSIGNISGFTYGFPWTFGSATSTAVWTLAANLVITGALTLTNGTLDVNNKTVSPSVGITVVTGSATLNNTGGTTLSLSVGITHTSGTLTLGTNLTSSGVYTLTAGTLSLVTFTLNIAAFSSANANVRTLAFGTGKIIINSTATATVWTTATVTNLTVTGTSLVEFQGGAAALATKTINTGTLTEAQSMNFSLLDSSTNVTYTFTAANAVKNLIVNGLQTVSNISITIYGSFTHTTTNGTTTFTAGANAWTFAATSGTYNITPASSSFTYDFPWTFGSAASTATWSLQNVITIGATRAITFTNGTLDANNYNFSGGVGITVITGTFTLNNTGGTVFLTSIPITHTSGTLNLGTTLTITAGSGYTFTAGTLSLGSSTLNTPVFSSSNANVRTLAFDTGKIVINTAITSTIWTTATVTNLTVTGTPLVECKGGGAGVTKTINAGALSEANAISFSLIETTGTATYAFTAANTVKNLIINGVQTISNIAITIYGAFTHTTTNGTTTFTAGANAWTFGATSGSYSIGNIAGFTYDWPWTFGSAASTAIWTLAANLTLGGTRQLSLVNGTFDMNNLTISAAGFTIVTGTPTLANTGGSSPFTTSLPFTHTSGSFTLPFSITTTATTGYAFTAGTLSLSTFTLTSRVFTSSNANVRTIAFGTGNIAVGAGGSGGTLVDFSTATNLTTSGTTAININYAGASAVTINSPVAAPNSISYNFTAGTYSLTLGTSGIFGNLNFTGFSGTLVTGTYTINGNVIYSSTMSSGTLSNTATVTFAGNMPGQTNYTITSNNYIHKHLVTINMSTNTYTLTLQDNFNMDYSGAGGLFTNLTLTQGTFVLNNFSATLGVFSSTNANVRGINYGTSGVLTIPGNNAGVWDTTIMTNFTSTGTPYVNFTYTGVNAVNLSMGLSESQSTAYPVSFGSSTSGIVFPTASVASVSLSGSYGSINLTGFGCTIANATRTIYGNLTIPASGGTLTAGALVTTFASSSSQTITSNGRTLDFPITFNGTGGTCTLQTALTTGTTRTVTLTAGTLNLNNLTLTTGLFNSSGSGVRTLAFGTGQLALASSGSTIFDITTATNFSTTGTPYINCTYTGSVGTRTIVTGFTEVQASAGYSIATSGTSGIVLSSSATDIVTLSGSFYSINLTGFTGTLSNAIRTVYGNWTNPASGGTYTAGVGQTSFSGSSPQTVTTNGRTLSFPFNFNSSSSTVTLQDNLTCDSSVTTVITSGTLNLNNRILTTGIFNASTSISRTLAFGTSGQLALTASGVTIFDMSTATNFSTTGTVYINCTYTGSVGTRTLTTAFTEAQAAAGYSIATSGTTGIVLSSSAADTVALTGSFYDINLTGFTGTLSNTARTIYGNLTTPSTGGIIASGTLATTFGSSSSQTITSNSRILDFPITFNGTGTWTLQTALTIGSNAAGRVTTLTAGTLNLNNYTMTVNVFNSSSSNARTLAFSSSGQLAINGNALTIFDITTATNFSTTGTAYVNCTYTGATGTRTIVTGLSESQVAQYSIATSGTSGIVLSSSATDIIALTGNFYNINLAGFVGTLSNTARTIYGNWSNPATGGTYTAGAVATTFGATSSKTITTNGRTLDFALTFDGVGGTWTLQDNLTIGATRILTWNNGTLDLNNRTLSSPASITVSGGATGSFRLLNTGGSSAYTTTVALTHTSGELYLNYNCTFGAYTWTAGTITLNSYTLTCTTWTSTSTTARTFAFGTGNLTVTGSGACFNMLGATNQVITGTPNVNITNATTTATSVVPGVVTEAQSLNFIFNSGGISYTLTFLGTASHAVRNVTMTSFAGIWAAVSTGVIYGSFSGQSSGSITASASAITFGGTNLFGDKTVTTNGVSLAFPVTFNGVGSYWYTGAAFRCDASHAMTFTNGTLNCKNLTSAITALSFTMLTGTFSLNMANFGSTAFTHTSGSLTITGIDNTGSPVLSGGFYSGAYTFTAGTLIPCTNMQVVSFISNGTAARTLYPGITTQGGTSYGSMTCTGAGTVWNTSTLTGYTYTNSGYDFVVTVTNATSTATSVLTGAWTEAQALSFIFTGNGTLTFLGTAGYTANNVDMSSFAGTWAATAACTIYGSLYIGFSMTLTESASVMTLAGAVANTSKTFTSAIPVKFPITFNSTVSKWTLGYHLTMGATAARALTFVNGIFDTAGWNWLLGFAGSTVSVNTGSVTLYNLYQYGGTLPFTLTSGTLTLDITNSTDRMVIATNFTHTAGTLIINRNFVVYDFIAYTGANGGTYTFTAGTINLNNNQLFCGKFVASGATTRVIAFGTGSIYVEPLAASTAWDQTTIGTFSYTGTSNIIIDTSNIPSPYTAVTTIVPGAATITNALNFSIQGTNNSEPVTILGTAGNAVRDLTFNNINKWNAIAACTIFGSLSASSVTLTESASILTFGATAAYGTATIYFGSSAPFPITFNGVGGTFQLTTSLTMGATVARALTLVNGTLDLNGNSINLGFAGSTMSTNTNTVSIINAQAGINLPFTVTSGSCSIRGPSTYDIASPAYFSSNFTLTSGTLTLASNMKVDGTFTFTATTLSLVNYELSCGSFLSTGTTTRTLNFGGGAITCTGAGTAFSMAGATGITNSNNNLVNITYAGTSPVTVAPGAMTSANSLSFNISGGAYPLTFLNTASHAVSSVNFGYYEYYDPVGNFTSYITSNWAGSWATATSTCTIYGSLQLTSSMSLTASASAMTFASTSGFDSIYSNGPAIPFPITINGVAGVIQIISALTLTSTLTLTNGTLDLNGYTLTVGSCTTATGTKNITFNGGTLVISGSGATAFNNAVPLNFTTTAGTGTGKISMLSATAKTFVGGSSTYNCTLSQDGAGTLTLTGSNTFNNIANGTQPASILFTAATTTTVANWSVSGISGSLITIGSVTAAVHTLSKSGGGVVSSDYLSISFSTASGSGATWYAGSHSTNGGSNTGWIFTAPPSSSLNTGAFLAFF